MRRVVLLVLLTLALGVASPAHAASRPLQLSRDGVTWSGSLRDPLFDPDFRWVPGDRQVESFWVRNASPADDARLTIEAIGVDDPFFASGDLDVLVRIDGGAWRSLAGVVAQTTSSLESGGHRRVDVAVSFASSAVNALQRVTLPLSFAIDLTQTTGALDPAAPGTGDHGLLPRTGSVLSTGTVVLAVLALASGYLLLVAGRRRSSEGLRS